MNKKYLVTGAAGFIGSNILRRLLEIGADVLALDNFSTGKRENIEPFLSSITFYEHDICDTNFLIEVMQGVDCVLHLGAIPSVPRSIENPINSNNANVAGTLSVLWAAKEVKVAKVVYSSSSSVYGDSPALPKKEDMAVNPLSPYAVSKYAGELYARVFHEIYGLETVSLRYFNVFGLNQDPRSQYAAVIPRFITRILNDQPITIYGDGEQSRDFTFIENAVEANLLAAHATRVGGKVFNIACGERTALNEIINYIRELTRKNVKIEYAAVRPGDIKHSLADINAARVLLGYSPKATVKQGINKTIEWYARRIK